MRGLNHSIIILATKLKTLLDISQQIADNTQFVHIDPAKTNTQFVHIDPARTVRHLK